MHLLTTRYNESVLPKLTQARQYPSTYLIPKVSKVSVNCGIGDVMTNGKAVEDVTKMLASITGQKPAEAKARTAISGFKIRQGQVVGLKTTLRGDRMNDFLLKLIEVALPRTRDFRGLKPSAITEDGTLNIGIRDSMIFPEVANQEGTTHSLQVTVVSNARSKEEARLLYESLGFVFGTEEDTATKKKGRKSGYKRK